MKSHLYRMGREMKHKYITLVIEAVLLVCLVAATLGCAAGKERRVADMM